MVDSIEVADAPFIPGETKPRLSRNHVDGTLVTSIRGVNSLYDNFLRGQAAAGEDAPAFGYRAVLDGAGTVGPYQWISWKTFHERFKNFSSGLINIGASANDNVGIMMANRLEWVLTEFAGYYQRIVTVPLYNTLGKTAVASMINETEMRIIVCTNESACYLIEAIDILPLLENIIVVDSLTNELMEMANECSVSVHHFRMVESMGASKPVEPERLPNLSDLATIIYTSGTSSYPKGVEMTHGNIMAVVGATTRNTECGDMVPINPKDISVGFLPLAHCLGRAILHMMLGRGCPTAFTQNDSNKLMEDIKELKPTVFVGVPRLFNRIQDKVLIGIKSKGGITSTLFNRAINVKKNNLKSGSVHHWLWDRVVFKSIREIFGGRLKFIISGSAPISPETLEFLRCCFACSVVEGYGLTETFGPAMVTRTDDIEPGNVGNPLPSVVAKLVSVPDMNYTVDDKPFPRGELLIKGTNVTAGYYKQPEKTKEAFIDGWLKTGDIAMLDDRGRFHIIDRRKNIFKLSQGEYIAPEKIENIITDNFIVDQIFIYGNSFKSYLVGVVVPDEEFLKMFLVSKGVISRDSTIKLQELCEDKNVRKVVLGELNSWSRSHDLKGFEIPKNILLYPNSFETLGLLTPTLKLKRQQARSWFKEAITKLYDELSPSYS